MFMLASYATTAHAYRPFNGTDAEVAERGEFELELGPVQLFHSRTRDLLFMPATVLNLGIFPRTELVVDFVGTIPLNGDSYQVRGTDVFLKFLLLRGALQKQRGPSLALETGPLTPEIHGAKGFGASANLIVSERWAWFVAHLDNIAELSRSALRFAWTNTLITEYRFSETIWPVLELLWSREFVSHTGTYSALVGGIWRAIDGVDLDAALIVSRVNHAPAFEARLGFTWAFQLWGQPGSQPEHSAKRYSIGSG
jgi:hypothetical protein